jgi:hypothetical protein
MSKFDDRLFREEPRVSKFADDPEYPRSKFSDVEDEPELPPVLVPFTIAWVLERYYTEFKERIGTSQMYTIRRLQKSPHIGPKMALKLSRKRTSSITSR